MKLFRHGPVGQEKPALVDPQGQARDLSGVLDDSALKRSRPPAYNACAPLTRKVYR